jgi:hypothetical protein
MRAMGRRTMDIVEALPLRQICPEWTWEDWRRKQSEANPSPRQFPGIWEKYRDLGRSVRTIQGDLSRNPGAFRHFAQLRFGWALRLSREFGRADQGFFLPEQATRRSVQDRLLSCQQLHGQGTAQLQLSNHSPTMCQLGMSLIRTLRSTRCRRL